MYTPHFDCFKSGQLEVFIFDHSPQNRKDKTMFIVAREYNGSSILMYFKSHNDFHRHLSSAHFQVDEYECLEVEGMNLEVKYELDEDSNENVKCALCTTQECTDFLVVYQDDQILTQIIIDSQLYDFKLFNQEYNIKLFKTS